MVRYFLDFLYLTRQITPLTLLFTLLAGCATPMGSIDAPPKWCMAKSTAQEPLKAGDDLVQKHADLKEQSAKDASRVRCLQRYARAVTN